MSRSESGSRSRSTSRVSTNRETIRWYKCKEYDNFVIECPNCVTDEDSDQNNLNHSTLQTLTQNSLLGSDMHESIEFLKLQKVRMTPLYFAFK